MKPNYFFHPLVKGLCLILCLISIMGVAFCGLRLMFVIENGATEQSPKFELYEYQTRNIDGLYWPSGAWDRTFYTHDQIEANADISDGYYWADDMFFMMQELIGTEDFSNLIEAYQKKEINPMYLKTEAVDTETILYPTFAEDYLINTVRSFTEGGGNFRFRCSIYETPNEEGTEKSPWVFCSNVKSGETFRDSVIADTAGVRFAKLGETGLYIRCEYGLAKNLTPGDAYDAYYTQWSRDCAAWEKWIMATAAFAVAAIILLVLVLCQTGVQYRTPGVVRLSKLDRLPLGIVMGIKIGIGGLITACMLALLELLTNQFSLLLYLFQYQIGRPNIQIIMLLIILCWLLIGYLILSALRGFVRRVRGGYWWHHTVTWIVLRFLFRIMCHIVRGIKTLLQHMSILWRWLVICAIFGFWTLIVMASWDGGLIFFWVLTALVLGIAGAFWLVQLDRIKEGAEKLAKGEVTYQIDTLKMIGTPRALANHLNRIGNATQIAVEERMKSERFRSELITNVSHDLKTPLTSIINYADLMSKETCENPTMRQYIEVLCRQSNRLKKLTDDLLEASKASSGAVSVTLAPTDAAELLTQAVGEYEERFQKCDLYPVVEIKKQPLTISADGRHLWRVFDNLLSNICKYSMKGTRVYLTAQSGNGEVILTFRNISANPIHISADELTERFVRGDASRHTEGSGLGLAIADSLTALQGGTLELTVDGDLFKAILRFKEIQTIESM
ncbi:MAG: sensor histidine kinase [Clostridia bacterium]|nr:sensor histidine kinase [Clostridia bacterium]